MTAARGRKGAEFQKDENEKERCQGTVRGGMVKGKTIAKELNCSLSSVKVNLINAQNTESQNFSSSDLGKMFPYINGFIDADAQSLFLSLPMSDIEYRSAGVTSLPKRART